MRISREENAEVLDRLLIGSSRTFALSIPLLPEPTRREVTLAYLLFRIADTFEDATRWPRTARVRALHEFSELLRSPDPDEVRRLTGQWCQASPVEHEGYVELLTETPRIFDCLAALSPQARANLVSHTIRTSDGMAGFVRRGSEEGELRLQSLQDLKDYCYVVAGIVGEMLTELYLLGYPPAASRARELRDRARVFGEGLQLVNILKDSDDDGRQGRTYLPRDTSRPAVFELARRDLDEAAVYARLLQETQAPRGMIAFNALPVLLARATLDKLEADGPGAKITRDRVFVILEHMNAAIDAGDPPV